MMIFIHSPSGELFPLVADLGDILQSRCGDHDHDKVDGGFDNHDKKKGCVSNLLCSKLLRSKLLCSKLLHLF